MSQTDGGGDSKAPAKKRQKLTEAEKEEKRKEREAKEKEREAKEKERAEKVCLPMLGTAGSIFMF
jgi:chromatin assembly factor 1 subunit A